MADFQIVATRKDGPDFDRRIDAFQLAGGEIYSIAEMIAFIRDGHTFWTMVGISRAEVHLVQQTLLHRQHLTTSPDGRRQNNLLLMPDC
jgi:hypothetical protein